MLLSGALHGMALATLWFTASDIRTPEPTPPEVVDATILSTPSETQPKTEPERTPTVAPRETNLKADKTPRPVESTRVNNASKAPSKQASNDTTATSKDAKNNTTDTTSATSQNNSSNESLNTANNSGTSAAETGGNSNAVTKPPLNGVPVAVSPIGGFQIEYDVTASKGSIEAGGGATLTFKRSDGTYSADLSAKASIGGFSAHAEGEIRNDTLATTRFKDGRTISFLGMGKERAGSNFIISYPEKTINFGSASSGTSPLPYTVVYDYLSAIVYLQALLQQHPEQAQAGKHLQLPIGKRTTVEMATVTFKASERLSTAEGAFDGAVPASIQIPSGSIQSIDVWFVPEKKYRPLQIELGFTSGKAKLISRKSS